MQNLRLHLALAALAACTSLVAHADTFPYANPGTVAPTTLLVATSTGNLTSSFLGSGAGGEDAVRLYDATAGTYSPYIFDNRSTAVGAIGSFGMVTAGDALVFEVSNSDVTATEGPSFIMASDPAFSSDGVNHFYVANLGGTFYLGAEDNSLVSGGTDYNYNDIDFSLNGSQVASVTSSPVPEPSSLALLGTGLVGLYGMVRSRLRA